MLKYPVILTPDTNRTIRVVCPDLPEVNTFGDNEEEALIWAVDAIETALSMYIDRRKEIPAPSPREEGMHWVELPALTEAKVELYEQMRKQNIGKAELARRLNIHLPQVDRLLDVTHNSRFDQIEAALRAVGKRIEIKFRKAPIAVGTSS